MRPSIELEVWGKPAPQGSKRHVGGGRMIESAGQSLTTWREDVKQSALAAVRRELNGVAIAGAVSVEVTFMLKRPQSHFRTGRNAHLLRDAAPQMPSRKPDIDKLLRSTFDALTTAGVYGDDSQIVSVVSSKTYTNSRAGALISVLALEDQGEA